MHEQLYTIPEVARYLKMSKSKVYDLAKQGKIPAIHIGKNVRVRESDLMKWMEKQAQISDIWFFPRL